MARAAVDHAYRTDFVFVQGEAQLTLAFVLDKLGRREGAAQAAHTALELYEAKGDQPGIAQARAVLEELGAPA